MKRSPPKDQHRGAPCHHFTHPTTASARMLLPWERACHEKHNATDAAHTHARLNPFRIEE
jgi:hypothetical protein